MKKAQLLIAFAGMKGSGKSTAAQILCDSPIEGRTFVRQSFAEPIREMLRIIGFNSVDFNADKEVRTYRFGGKSARHAMQTLGTEWGREMMYRDIWVDVMRHRIINEFQGGNCVVIDDLRYENEADMVHEFKGFVVKLEPDHLKPLPAGELVHPSETGIPDRCVDVVLHPKGLDDLRSTLLNAMVNGWFTHSAPASTLNVKPFVL